MGLAIAGGIIGLVGLLAMASLITLGATRGWRAAVGWALTVATVAVVAGMALFTMNTAAMSVQQKQSIARKLAAAKAAGARKAEDDNGDVYDYGAPVDFDSGERITVHRAKATGNTSDGRKQVAVRVTVANPTKHRLAFNEQNFDLYDDHNEPARFDPITYSAIPRHIAAGDRRTLTLYFDVLYPGTYAVDYGEVEWQ